MPQRLDSRFFFFNDTATTEIYTLSLHDALPISGDCIVCRIDDGKLRADLPAADLIAGDVSPGSIREGGYRGWHHRGALARILRIGRRLRRVLRDRERRAGEGARRVRGGI